MGGNEKQHQPIFYDETNRRASVLGAVSRVLTVCAVLGAFIFLLTIAKVPLPNVAISAAPAASAAPVAAQAVRQVPKLGIKAPVDQRGPEAERFVLRHDAAVQDAKARLKAAIKRDNTPRAIPAAAISPGHLSGPIRAVFYQNQDDNSSIESFQHHVAQTTHLLPTWLELTGSGDVKITRELADPNARPYSPKYDDTAIRLARANGVAILPVLQNADQSTWSTNSLHAMVSNPASRAHVITRLLDFVDGGGYQGVNIDLETDQAADRDGITAFMGELAAGFHPHGLLVTQDIQMDSEAYAIPTLARYDDFLVPMIYDQHSDGTGPGPVAAQDWYEQELSRFMAQAPASKVVLGLAEYGYDWAAGSQSPDSQRFQDDCRIAADSLGDEEHPGDGIIRIDPHSLNPYFTYHEDATPHTVWLQDAVTAYNEMKSGERYHPLGAAIWRLGSEDPSLWQFFNRGGNRTLAAFDPARLTEVTYNYFGVTFAGEGDILDVQRQPTPGSRTIHIDRKTGLISAETYTQYPMEYVVRRRGLVDAGGVNTPRAIALTFDDGPDPRWTPRILDILDREKVKATFFVVGENAEANPGLLQREWNDGMEIGNHSFTHPEMDQVKPLRVKLELDATQRVIEAMTGHMTMLFRAPNRADSEPSSEADFDPIVQADKLGYLFVGEQNDPTDWLPGIQARQIADRVIANRDLGNCVLLHDAGGLTREQTIAALPAIIEGLRSRGYHFVTVSKLTGLSHDQIFPAVTGAQRWTVAFDRGFFYTTYFLGVVMTGVFIAAIILGIARILVMGVLAVIQRKKEAARRFVPGYQPVVSVVIAAYNEAKVINKTIGTLLGSDYPDLEIVVVDDGSRDGTAEIVEEAYGSEPRVVVLRKENGGKASALNVGIRECGGEIIVALDADTMFAADTVGKLVRHFADPAVGAVSGNVKVGNRNNPLTIWQAVEYITSQNFDRRAFDLLNCITVVPGAVGAWRRDAVALAGLYSSQTLAEDTDLTFKVRRLGYRIVTDNEALAYTEAPDNLPNLAKQRFRWAFGTLQCLWKHRDALFNRRYGAFGFVAMPSLWIYQIAFQVMAPIVDLAILWSIVYENWITPTPDHHGSLMLLGYWAVFSTVELAGAWLAFHLDGEDKRLLPWLPLQRIVYRQLMYGVIWTSISHALGGRRVGWGKFERRGTVVQPIVRLAPGRASDSAVATRE